jgi:hypothetical protein
MSASYPSAVIKECVHASCDGVTDQELAAADPGSTQ